ncbi:hypothetical protein ACLQ3B_18140 [Micromonospora sp. DT53]|uniref:hypothetical protein n=1 Tax=Micromonospora sp. DT53 TaxID=3393444 RepID=UPI003CF92588
MSAFDLDAQVVRPNSEAPHAQASITSIVTRLACTRTPICSNFSCLCTLLSCTVGCAARDD